jgi:hypothetical protein
MGLTAGQAGQAVQAKKQGFDRFQPVIKSLMSTWWLASHQGAEEEALKGG